MTVSGPKVRDFTDRQRKLSVTVDADPVYEILLALFMLGAEMESADDDPDSMLIERLNAHDDNVLRSELDALGSCGELWLSLIGLAYDLEIPRSVETLAETIETMDPVEFRTTLLRNVGIKASRGYADDVIAAAAGGDADATAALFADQPHDKAIRQLMDGDPASTGQRIASVLRRFDTAVGAELRKVQPVLERDAASTRAMARTMSAADLVEKATNGITFEMQPQVSGVLLIPSVVVRPWVVISEHGTLRVFCYSVADEILEGDLDAPPAYMVEVFKALGDERRLRILGILAEGDAGLREIADRVDLAKSTAHHHLRTLRGAGLVRVVVSEDDKRYGLRRDTVPEVSRLLEGYLSRGGHTATRKDTA